MPARSPCSAPCGADRVGTSARRKLRAVPTPHGPTRGDRQDRRAARRRHGTGPGSSSWWLPSAFRWTFRVSTVAAAASMRERCDELVLDVSEVAEAASDLLVELRGFRDFGGREGALPGFEARAQLGG